MGPLRVEKDRLKRVEKPLKKLAIDTKNNVRVPDSDQVRPEGATFQNEQELRRITAERPLSRLVEVWNQLPGVRPVAKFTDRRTACARIWKAVQEQEATVGGRTRTPPRPRLPAFPVLSTY